MVSHLLFKNSAEVLFRFRNVNFTYAISRFEGTVTHCPSNPAGSGNVSASGFDVHGINGLACGHEKAITLRTTKAKIGANFR